jgi:hypothetical protein
LLAETMLDKEALGADHRSESLPGQEVSKGFTIVTRFNNSFVGFSSDLK